MPFAGYKDFSACVAANLDKRDPEAYCGKIKHQIEGGDRRKSSKGRLSIFGRNRRKGLTR